MIFPVSVGDFQRVSLVRYDADGLDVSAGYNLVTSLDGIVATVYVYPAPSLVSIGSPSEAVASARTTLCDSEFERRKREIISTHPGANLIAQQDVASPQGSEAVPGKMAAYEFEDVFWNKRQSLQSELYVYCYVGGKWAFEYRFTSPKSSSAADMIPAFMKALTWTISAKS